MYAFDGPSTSKVIENAPAPITAYTDAQKWYLRDANWSPDFPTSAERILTSYTNERRFANMPGLPPSVVIAFEPAFFERLLAFVGPVSAEGKTYSSENVMDFLEKDVEQDFLKKGLAVSERKKIVAEVGGRLMEKLKKIPAEKYAKLVHLLAGSLADKQILLYAQDPAMLKPLDARGWTGRTLGSSSDFLWVVDANLGGFKTDRVLDRNIGYTLDTSDANHLKATVTLTYHHTHPGFDYRTTRYRSYTRIYVPDGSTFISSSGSMKNDLHETHGVLVPGTVDVTHELGKTVFGTFWAIEPGKTGTLSFTYELPPSVVTSIAENQYILVWQKQPGVDNATLTLDLRLGKNIQTVSPPEDQKYWGDTRVQMDLVSQRDQTIQVKLAP